MSNFFKIVIIFFLCGSVHGQFPKIKIFSAYHTKHIHFRIDEGSYSFEKDSIKTYLKNEEYYDVKVSGNKVYLQRSGINIGAFDTLVLKSSNEENDVYFKIQDLRIKARRYSGDFLFTVEKGRLKILNKVPLSEYLSGVIETEGGGGKHLEYYKVQAVLSRTYYIGHLDRHESEGYQLCDVEHCQAYKSKVRYTPDIKKAVLATQNLIAVDSTLNMVSGLFSANCGGQTTETDWIWNNPVPYLKTTVDTFCIHTQQAQWTKSIPQWEWKKFMIDEYGFPIDDKCFKDSLYHFYQGTRKAFYHGQELGIPLRDLRIKFKLKSTFFSCYPEGNQVILEGRGFGHGAGMCQEGAMNMALKGFNYRQIFNFYFTGVRLMDYHLWINFTQMKSENL